MVIECTPGGGGATPVASKGTVIPRVMKGIRRGRRQPVPIYQVKVAGSSPVILPEVYQLLTRILQCRSLA